MSYYYRTKNQNADNEVELNEYKGLTKPNVKPSAEAKEKIIKSQSKSSESSEDETAVIIKDSNKERKWTVKNTDAQTPTTKKATKAIKPVPTLEEHVTEKEQAPPVQKPVRKRGGPTKSGKTGNDVFPPMRVGANSHGESKLDRIIKSGVAEEVMGKYSRGAAVGALKKEYGLSDYMWNNIKQIHKDMEWGQKKLAEAQELMRQKEQEVRA
jgi:hypothetical protein